MIVEKLAKLLMRGVESPNIPLTGANIGSILGNEMLSKTGLSVTRDSSLALAPLKSGVEMISADVAKLPVFVYRTTSNGNREPLRAHPASRLLRRMANPFLTSHVFIQTLVGHALLHRGGYARIFRNGAGRPTDMDLLDPESTHPVIVNNELFYQTIIEARDVLLPANEVFHLKGLGFDGLDGWSLIDKLREMIGLSLASQQYAAVYFANNAKPSIVIKFPGYLKDAVAVERFRHSWGDVHAGVNRSSKPAILEGGAEIQPFSLSNEDSQFIQSRQFDVRMIAAALKIPPHKLGDDSRTSFASLEQENQRYLDEGIDPWLRAFEVEAMRKLLTEEEFVNESVNIEFTRAAFMRTDLKARFEAYGVGIQNGFMSRAQVRRLENWNVDEPELEEFLQPLNMAPAGQEPEPPPEAPQEESEEDEASRALERLVQHITSRFANRLQISFKRKAKTHSGLIDWIEGLEADHAQALIREVECIRDREMAERLVFRWLGRLRSELQEASGSLESATQVLQSELLEAPQSLSSEVLRWTTDGEQSPQNAESKALMAVE